MIGIAKEKHKKALSKSSRSSQSSSSSRDTMSVDSGRRTNVSRDKEEPPAVPRPRLRIRVLTMVEQIAVKNDYEQEALELLKKQNFGHAKRFETCFLIKTGLKQDMNNALTAVRWENFTDIVEPGSQLLTMEFLISLAVEETGAETKVYFRLFNEQFVMKLKDFNIAFVTPQVSVHLNKEQLYLI